MQRYLIHVSYIGTQFRGVQKIFNHNEPHKNDPTTIQGCLEIALKKLKPLNKPYVIPSSRTDTGVHALHSTFHVDLFRSNSKPYETNGITTNLNKYFYNENLQIRILNTQYISNDFHCRFNAKSRTYLYRLAILKNKYFKEPNKYIYHIPIEEHNRCYFLCYKDFNIIKMQEAAELFQGLHDFRTFMGKGSHVPNKITRRTLEIKMTKGVSSACLENSKYGNETNIYDYWNICCKSEGFLYNQIRRIVGTVISVGRGKLTPKDVKFMLQVPSHLSWNPRVKIAPSHGLYLCKVEYAPDDLKANIITKEN